jgi:hypothetical protein
MIKKMIKKMINSIISLFEKRRTYCSNHNCVYLKRGKCTLKIRFINYYNKCSSYDSE